MLTAAPDSAKASVGVHEFLLPLRGRYCPIGVPLKIFTNSEAVLAAADPAWMRYPALPGARPVTFRIVVEDQNSSAPAEPALPRGQGHIVSMVHGRDNFAVCDLSASFAFARLTRDVAADSTYVRYHFLEPAVYLMIEARHFCPVHASCIALNGRAILLCGDSGAGKTSLAYACARQGWAYLADDATYIVRDRPGLVVAGRPFSIRFRSEARALFPELGAYRPERRPNGKLNLEIDTDELGLTVALESGPCCVVFLNRQKARGVSMADAHVAPFSRAEAVRQTSKAIRYGGRTDRAAQLMALRDLMRLPVLELTYSGLAAAERALRKLAGEAA